MKTLRDLLPLSHKPALEVGTALRQGAESEGNKDERGFCNVLAVCKNSEVWDDEEIAKEVIASLNSVPEMEKEIESLRAELETERKRLRVAVGLLVEARQERDKYKEFHTALNSDMAGWEHYGSNPMAYWRGELSKGNGDYISPIVEAWDKAAVDAENSDGNA